MIEVKHIDLFSGIVTASAIHGADDQRVGSHRPGDRVYFVDAVDAEGGRFGLFDSTDAEEATSAARLCGRDFAVPVVIEGSGP